MTVPRRHLQSLLGAEGTLHERLSMGMWLATAGEPEDLKSKAF